MTAPLLAARFLLELALLAGLAVGGWALAEVVWAKVLLAVALPVAAALVWGFFVSPRAKVMAPLPLRLVIEVLLFGSAASLLWLADHAVLALVLVSLEVVVLTALLLGGHPPGPPTKPVAASNQNS